MLIEVKRLLTGLALLFAAPSETWAQQTVIRLQCDGKYTDFSAGRDEFQSDGDFIEIGESTVRLFGFVWFGSDEGQTYRISHNTNTGVGFIFPTDQSYSGHISRLSGQLSISAMDRTKKNKIRYFYDGVCRPAKPLF
jgi:hypothetical protein